MTELFTAILPGSPVPLGSHFDGEGVNFAVYSERARAVEICLFDESGQHQLRRIRTVGKTGHVWHVYLRGLRPGTLYGIRARGPYMPQVGYTFNPAKLLVDPYARALAGRVNWQAPLQGFVTADDSVSLQRDTHDDAWGVPKAVVIQDEFDWQGDRPLAIPWRDTVIYEVHVKGFTYCHPEVPEGVRGTYAGLASAPAIRHLQSLGVTAVELLPIHAHADSLHLYRNGLTNYWGYDTLAYFAPEARYSSKGDRGAEVNEFKEMVRTLHRNGIEVILDVVYNHTCEGNHLGPTLSLRGLDNQTYYRLLPEDQRFYADYTGTGNSLNTYHRQTLKLVMDSLRYWVQEMHVDGFRFDLAVTLARTEHAWNVFAPFLSAVHQDPVLSRVKLIAEPWDLGQGGYQVGSFPAPWSEWNGKYRDSVRRFWRGDENHAPDMAYRLTGSSDLYDTGGRSPYASINFITAHDGFTLQDLVSYNEKHNEANAEGNRDGTSENLSFNHGVEGPTKDPAICALRERQKRNLLATLLISQGVPMLLGGDELSRTQEGNNNAYCQDNEVSWFNWQLDQRQRDFLEFSRRMLAIRRRHPSLRRGHFFRGRPTGTSPLKDITWLHETGKEMTHQEWMTAWVRCFGMLLDGSTGELDADGDPVSDDILLVLLNASEARLLFRMPSTKTGDAWRLVIDTARPHMQEDQEIYWPGYSFPLEGRSLAVLRSSNGRA